MNTDDARPGLRLRRLRRLTGTVRFRVTALATAAVLAVLLAAGFGLVVAQRRVLVQNLDENMQQGVDTVEAEVRAGRVPTVLSGFGDDDTVAQVVSRDQQVVASTANVVGRAPIARAPKPGHRQTFRTVDHLPTDQSDFRVLSRRVEGPNGVRVIHLGATLGDVQQSIGALVRSLTVAVPAVVLLLAGMVWLLVGRTLRPVEAIRDEVADITGSDLKRRVPEPGGDDEISRLANTMNAMLDRLEESVRRQHRFVADASHELRSPLTRIRSELEVDLAHPDRADAWATHRSVLEEATGLQRTVEDLLHLARTDAGVVVTRHDLVDLDDVVLGQARALRAQGRVTVDTRGVGAAQVRGDAAHLTRALSNLGDNAARHAATTVTFTVAEHGDTAVVTVRDDGPGIPPEQQERVFGRFVRLDEARHPDHGGTGLGLAIARDVVGRHGGTLRLDPNGQGAVFVITLPLAGTDTA